MEEYEALIGDMLITTHLQSISQREVTTALQQAGLDTATAQNVARRLLNLGMGGGVLSVLGDRLGKSALQEIALSSVSAFLERHIGKDAGRKVRGRTRTKPPQTPLGRLASGMGWVWWVYEAGARASSATRITLPPLVYLAAMRCVHRIGSA